MNRSPTVATIVAIFAVAEGRLQVLLVHRTGEPEAGTWALPGGLWDCNESLNESATRKLVQETGATDVYLEQLFTTSGLDASRDAVAVAYFALVEAGTVRLREEEAWRPAWFAVDELPPLAFDNNRLIDQAVERIRAKLDYTNIAFGLMASEFTVRELQGTYEAILGEPLDRRNFRKRMISTSLIEATGKVRREGAHRPAELFRFTSREPVFL
ncbi:MAG: NUDIX domain-containing protein [Chloroflexi bacterium]|nr:NUDIX domain-containing protein [Chloroflexota bacterium]MDA1147535.1 NUDIX domain-containing protein [Chloroflexota bacterium]